MTMLLIYIISILLTLGYVGLMIAYRYGWATQPEHIVNKQYVPHTKISVIIPARNEAANIGACVSALLQQQYPEQLYEVIVVDDHSDDDTATMVTAIADKRVRCLRLADYLPAGGAVNAYKKAAITAGVTASVGELIVTTDADCIAPEMWLRHIAALYEQEQPVMIVAPVVYKTNNSLVQVFQHIDFMSMQGITAAAHQLRLGNMSNGANLSFRKSTFEQVGGYEGIQHLASGDDYLLMMKMNKILPQSISYLKSVHATVSTLPQPDWKGFLQQRIRWASKSGKYNDARLTGILMLVYFFNVLLLVLAVGAVFSKVLLTLVVVIYVVKVIIELCFLIPVARFFGSSRVLWFFPFLQPLHILYIVIAGFLGFMGDYEWKGRRVK